MPALRFRLQPHVIATLLALPALAAHAQNAPAPVTPTGTLATINVEASADASAEGLAKPFAGGQVARGGRVGILGNQDLMASPFSTTSFTRDLISNQQAQSIGDVLLNDASVRQARGFGNFQQAYFIRGFPVFSDDVSYNGLYGLVPRQYMATEFVERVEVFRGANAFLSGAGAGAVGGGGIGGLVNVLPKRAGNEPLSEVSVGAQSGGQGYIAADVARRFGPDQSTGIRLNAARRDGGTAVDSEKHTLDAASIGLDWRSRTVRLSADIGYQNDRLRAPRPSITPASDLPIPTAPKADRNFAQPWTYSNSRDVFGTARGEVDITSNITAWAALGTRRSKEDNVLTPMTLMNLQGDTTGYRFDNARKDRVNTGEIGVRGTFQTGPVTHTVVASAASLSSDSRNAYALSGFSGIDSNIYRPVSVLAPRNDFFTGGVLGNPGLTEAIDTSSIALADTMAFADDSVLLTVGARRQKIEVKSFDYDDRSLLDSYSKSRTTPVVGLVVKPTREISLYANYIEGLVKGDVAPTTNSVTGQAVSNGGQVFAPYVSKQKEIGAKYDGGNIGAGIALFSTSKPSAYLQNNTYGTFGEQRNRGIELSVFGEPVKGLRLLGGLTLLDAEQRRSVVAANNGKQVIGVARHQFNLGAEWDVPGAAGLALNARVITTGKQYADAANTQVLPSWTRLDIGARYLVDLGNNRLLTLRGRIDNVLNKSYWASAGGYPGANYLVLGQPRTFVLTGTVNF